MTLRIHGRRFAKQHVHGQFKKSSDCVTLLNAFVLIPQIREQINRQTFILDTKELLVSCEFIRNTGTKLLVPLVLFGASFAFPPALNLAVLSIEPMGLGIVDDIKDIALGEVLPSLVTGNHLFDQEAQRWVAFKYREVYLQGLEDQLNAALSLRNNRAILIDKDLPEKNNAIYAIHDVDSGKFSEWWYDIYEKYGGLSGLSALDHKFGDVLFMRPFLSVNKEIVCRVIV